MTLYRYIGHSDGLYPDVLVPGEGSLVAHPGDEREWDEPPTDGHWIEVPAKPATQAKTAKD